MRRSAPIRFLIVVVAGWIGVRLAVLAPERWPGDARATAGPESEAVTFTARPADAQSSSDTVRTPADVLPTAHPEGAALPRQALAGPAARPSRATALGQPVAAITTSPQRTPDQMLLAEPRLAAPTNSIVNGAMPSATNPSSAHIGGRWTGSAWLLLRRDSGASLAPGGTLAGSQAGGRLQYRLNDDVRRPLALNGRIYVPLRRPAGAEAAIGLDWRPIAGVPIQILAERRQRLGREGRSAFSVALYGGRAIPLPRGWRLDSYAQAGAVGARSRDMFVDGAIRVVRTVGGIEIGGGLWGAAQPGAERVDGGPLATLPIRAAGTSLRLSAEYRFRIAGDARPASGPTLSLGVDFQETRR